MISIGDLPEGYQRCEYLRGLGTDETYIIIPKIDITNRPYVALEAAYQTYTEDTNTFGSILDNIRFEQGIGWTGKSFSYNFGNGYGCSGYPSKGNVQISNGGVVEAKSLANQRLTFEYKNDTFYLNGVEQTLSKSNKYAAGNLGVARNVYLFGTNRGEVKRYFNGKIYSFYVEGQIDLIPAIDSSSKPCMFDRLTRRPFYNAGTGEFLWG